MKKYTKEELYKMDAIEVYKLVLESKHIKVFPRGFWQQPEALQNAIKCTKYLIEDILKLNDEQLKEQLSIKLFLNNKLTGMLTTCFGNSPIKAILETYPERNYKPWHFKQVPQGYWTKDTGIEATVWLIETKLKLTDEQLKEQLSTKLFQDNGLCGMLLHCFDNSPIKAILETYPERNYKPWYFKRVPQGYWTKEVGVEATVWLIETKLKLTDKQLKEKLSYKLFQDNGLGGMLLYCFDNSPIQAILESYPRRNYKPWEFKKVGNKFWTKEIGIEATVWLIETKLKLTDKQLKEKLSYRLFKDNGLGGMLECCFDNSPFKAINETYPNKFKIEDFKNCNYYN